MARIELSKSTLIRLKEAINLNGDGFVHNDVFIRIDYEAKSIIVQNKHTGQEFELNCRDRRLIFKYFEK